MSDETEKPKNELTKPKTGTALSTDLQDELQRLKAFAKSARSRRMFEGTRITFVKGVWWAKDGDDQENVSGAEFIAYPRTLMWAWTKWQGKKPVDVRTGQVVEGVQPPTRPDLGDMDVSEWELDDSPRREPKDPWSFAMYVQMSDELGKQYVYQTSSRGGTDALANLADAYVEHCLKDRVELPILTLNSGSYKHPMYGMVATPELDIGGWKSEKDVESKAAEAAYDEPEPADDEPRERIPDDEIPF